MGWKLNNKDLVVSVPGLRYSYRGITSLIRWTLSGNVCLSLSGWKIVMRNDPDLFHSTLFVLNPLEMPIRKKNLARTEWVSGGLVNPPTSGWAGVGE